MTIFEKTSVRVAIAGIVAGIVMGVAGLVVGNWTRLVQTFEPPSACGAWRSDSSGKVYEFRCRADHLGPFDVLDAGKVIGDGMQVKYSVTASITVLAEDQPKQALLDLTLDDDSTLVGKFIGASDVEHGNIRFVRLAKSGVRN